MKKKYTQAEMARNWRKSLKDELDSLSSLEFQKKTWIGPYDPSIVYDFDEAVCSYFDDLFLNEKGIQYHVKEKDLTKEEAEILKPFNKAFGEYANKASYGQGDFTEEHQKILADPEWIKITEMAKEILTKIDFDKLP